MFSSFFFLKSWAVSGSSEHITDTQKHAPPCKKLQGHNTSGIPAYVLCMCFSNPLQIGDDGIGLTAKILQKNISNTFFSEYLLDTLFFMFNIN